MDEEHLSITFAIDVIITTLLYLILFRGHVFSEYLCIIQNTDTVIGVLIFVVCFRSLLNVFIQRQDRASKSVATTLFGSFFLVMCGITLFDVICIIYGAPLLSSVQETLYFSCLLTCLTVVPCCCVLGPDMASWYRVLCNNSTDNSAEMTVRLSTICSILGAWLGAFPIPLDWDRPWQVWPVSCVYGTTLGYGLGLILSHIHIYQRQMKIRKIKLG